MLVDDTSTSSCGAAPLELVDESERGARLGPDHEPVIGRLGHLDQTVAQTSGGVDRAVDRADAAFGLVEGAAHRGRVGDVGHDDRDLGAARLELAQLADPARGRVVVGVGGEPAVTRRGVRYVVGGEQHEVGLVLGREVRRKDAADAAERARDEVRAAARNVTASATAGIASRSTSGVRRPPERRATICGPSPSTSSTRSEMFAPTSSTSISRVVRPGYSRGATDTTPAARASTARVADAPALSASRVTHTSRPGWAAPPRARAAAVP